MGDYTRLNDSSQYGAVGSAEGAPAADFASFDVEPNGGLFLPDDDSNAVEKVPSAPPAAALPAFAGYGASYDAAPLGPPPAYDESKFVPEVTSTVAAGPQVLSHEEARRVFLEEISTHCCYGKDPATKCVIQSITPSDALHYKLETFSENRTTKWTHRPYRGTPVDGPMFGAPPPPWNIDVRFDALFQNKVVSVEVPHTANVLQCYGCHGHGKIECVRCHGKRRIKCSRCKGHGHTTRRENRDGQWVDKTEHCITCSGKGRVQCPRCHGHGKVTCTICSGACSLLHFIELTVEFKTHVLEHVVERTSLPDELVKNAGGKTMLEDVNVRILPVGYKEGNWAEVAQKSQQLLTQHASELQTHRVWQQRQNVRSIPVCDVRYEYSSKTHTFIVYGLEKRVWYDKYPADCCCGCNLL